MNEIPSEIVTEYVMNPATEDLLPNGRQLENGMVVLVEDNFVRERTYAHETLEGVHYLKRTRILETSRWCKVSDIEIDGDLVRFVGIYADGTKAQRRYNKSFAWFVKRDSLPRDEVPLKDWERELLDPEVVEYFEEYVPNNELVRRQVRVLRLWAADERRREAMIWGGEPRNRKFVTRIEAAAGLLEVHANLGISLENFGEVGNFVNDMLDAVGQPPFEPNNA